MSYRTIALASCLLVIGCGGAPQAVPETPVEGRAPGAKAPLDEPKKDADATPTPATPAVSPTSASEGGPGGKNDKVGQAVVDSKEALSGKLTQDDIRRILEKNGDVFGDCYSLGAGGKSKAFKGVVTVKATIGPSGTVNQVDVTKSTLKNTKVDACVRDAFRKIKFPRPQDGATSVITFPISFDGVEQIQ